MLVQFRKMQGAGNDFIFFDDLSTNMEISSDEVFALCDRHFGIGADGVILVRPSNREDCVAYMHYINSDGSLSQMCGNGIRCFAKYLVDNHLVLPDEDTFGVETLAGPRYITVTRRPDGTMETACVDMGEPSFLPASLPTTLPVTREDAELGPLVADAPLMLLDRELAFTCVSMGNPHAVTFIDVPPAEFDVPRIGAAGEVSPAFPERTNVEFAQVVSTDPEDARISLRVFERGCGETLACGTGCCATAVAAAATGRTPRKVTISVPGGTILVDWREDGHVFMTGPAETVFDGRVEVASVSPRSCHHCNRG